MQRNAIRDQFIKSHNIACNKLEAISGDASFRSYTRIYCGSKSYILMDAPPEHERTENFIYLSEFLIKNGFSAPKIYAHDTDNGFLLLEDFGDINLDVYIKRHLDQEHDAYHKAVELLNKLHTIAPPTDIALYSNDILLNEAELFNEWYLPLIGQTKSHKYSILWNEYIKNLSRELEPVVCLRDYHAENIMWLDEREGVNKIGLLDFQDALIGSPAYDLVSLLEDARRDVSEDIYHAMIGFYSSSHKGLNEHELLNDLALLGAQRNLKIIGIFSRLWLRDKKPQYLKYIPRVWKYLERDIKHPMMADLVKLLDQLAPKELRQKIHEFNI